MFGVCPNPTPAFCGSSANNSGLPGGPGGLAGGRSAWRGGTRGFEQLSEKSREMGGLSPGPASGGAGWAGFPRGLQPQTCPTRRDSKSEAGPTRSAVRAVKAAASLRTKPHAALGGMPSPRRPQAGGHGGSDGRQFMPLLADRSRDDLHGGGSAHQGADEGQTRADERL